MIPGWAALTNGQINQLPVFSKFASRLNSFRKQFYRVPYCVPAWGLAEHKAILTCLLTGKLIEGPHILRLYEEIRRKAGMRYVFGFNSGQGAIYAALRAWGVSTGDHVIMPSYCCETVAKAIIRTGAMPLFCDINESYNPSVTHILKLLNSSVKAIIFTHLFGNPGDIDKLEQALKERGLRGKILLIDDAAQSFGAKLNGQLVGTFGDAGIISFGPGKTMTATGGGLLITNSESLWRKVGTLDVEMPRYLSKIKRVLYWVLFRRWRRFTLPFLPLFDRVFGLRGDDEAALRSLSNIDAAIGSGQLKRLEELISVRTDRMSILDRWLNGCCDLISCCEPIRSLQKGAMSVCTKYVLHVRGSMNIEKLQDLYKREMQYRDIELMPLYFPIHMSPGWERSGANLPKTENLYNRILQIPIEPSMRENAFQCVMGAFKATLDHAIRDGIV